MQIFIHKNGQQIGPLSEADVRAQLASGALGGQDLVWWEGQSGWLPLDQTPLASAVATASPAIPSTPAPVAASPAYVRSPRTSGLAIASLVCGIAAFVTCITSLPAIICGHMALSEIRRTPYTEGRGMALAGLILGYLYLAAIVLIFLSSIVLSALSANVREVFKQINSQLEAAQTNAPASTNAAPANGP